MATAFAKASVCVALILAASATTPASADPTPTTAGAMDRIKGVANEATGNVKQGIGDVTGDRSLKTEGQIQELKGRAQQGIGEVKDAAENTKSKF
jgi:uncharacterized protein YjbJ (UPF0337 family)